MNLLLDANLSWRLCKLLEPHFNRINHVDSCGLVVPARDFEIWEWAKSNNAIIVTNDEDFLYLLLQKGFPPKIILLKTGNQSTRTLKEILLRHKAQIELLYQNPDHGLLEII